MNVALKREIVYQKREIVYQKRGIVYQKRGILQESMAGGYLAHLKSLGAEIRFVVASNGDKGTNDLTITSPQL